MHRRRVVWACLSAAIILTICFSARADGVHIPPLVYQVPATIPQQRALIAFRDGRETLIIESAFQTEAKEVGWIIPLPAVPDNILPVSSGAMKTISFRLQPEITHELPGGLMAACVLAGLVLFISLYVLTRPTRHTQPVSLIEVLLIIMVLAIMAGMFMPALSGARSAAVNASSTVMGVMVQKQVQVGSYEVAILTAQNADGLNQWLAANGFMSLPEKAATVVKDYIAEGWCFSAAKRQRTEGGLSTPHPIRFDFATKEAIYPMRLTAFAGAPVELEVFIVGQMEAVCQPMRREFCDSYTRSKWDIYVPWDDPVDDSLGSQIGYEGDSFRQDIGHPDLTTTMWNGCVLTKLSGNITPQMMSRDFRLSWTKPGPFRHHYYSERGARVTAWGWFVLLSAVFCTVGVYAGKRVITRRGVWWFLSRIVVRGTVLIIVVSVGIYLCLPKVEVNVLPRWPAPNAAALADSIGSAGLASSASRDDIEVAARGVVDSFLPRYRRNAFVGGPFCQEVSPGNYDIRQMAGAWYVVTFDERCWEEWCRIPPGQSKKP